MVNSDKEGGVLWQEAQDHCASLGGNLASINSQEEQDMLEQKINEYGPWNKPWIGLRATSKVTSLIY